MNELLRNKKLLAVLVGIVIVILGSIAFAVGKEDAKPVATKPATQTEQKTETNTASTTESTGGQTLNESTYNTDVVVNTPITSRATTTSRPASVPQPVTTPTPTQPAQQPQTPPAENPSDNGGNGGGTVVTDPQPELPVLEFCEGNGEMAPIELPVNAMFEGIIETCDGTAVTWQQFYKNMFWADEVNENDRAASYMIMHPDDHVSPTLRFVIVANDNPEYAPEPGYATEFAVYMPEFGQVFSFDVIFTAPIDL